MRVRDVLGVLVVSGGVAAAAPEAMGVEDDPGMQTGPLGIDDSRDASGTAWQPDTTPMFMWLARSSGWSLGLHENVFIARDDTASKRGEDQFLSINWLMGMAQHEVGDGDITLRAMLSTEPATIRDGGYPLLLQSGESYQGQPLHDRQHPHDLFMELAARYRRPLTDTLGLEVYAAPAGEPALGPAAFPHRFTSFSNPLAPLGHHWFDSTHITFGVVTAGIFTRVWKLEGSWFNGREPDEDRWNFDIRTPDSGSVRLSVNPTADSSAQVSWGRLASPEALAPDTSVQRATASVMWNHRLGDPSSDIAATAGVAQNNPSMGRATYASLAEATLLWSDTHTVFSRVEVLDKSGEDLGLPAAMADATFGMASFSAGYIHDFHGLGPLVPGIGGVATLDVIGTSLEPTYGTRTPWGGMVFVRLRPPTMKLRMQM